MVPVREMNRGMDAPIPAAGILLLACLVIGLVALDYALASYFRKK